MAAGQGAVQFATGVFNGREYAVKFCVIPTVFTLERSLYSDPALRSILPNVADVCPNENGAVTDPSGNPMPPFIVMERGEALDEWAAGSRPDVGSVAQVRGAPLRHPAHPTPPCCITWQDLPHISGFRGAVT